MISDISASVRRGGSKGTLLYPHRFKDGAYVVSKTRFKRDYVRLTNKSEIIQYLERGFSLRMSSSNSNKHKAPSLIRASNIQF